MFLVCKKFLEFDLDCAIADFGSGRVGGLLPHLVLFCNLQRDELSQDISSAKHDDTEPRHEEKRLQFRLGHLVTNDLAAYEPMACVRVIRPGRRFLECAVVSMLGIEDLAVGPDFRPTRREALIQKRRSGALRRQNTERRHFRWNRVVPNAQSSGSELSRTRSLRNGLHLGDLVGKPHAHHLQHQRLALWQYAVLTASSIRAVHAGASPEQETRLVLNTDSKY